MTLSQILALRAAFDESEPRDDAGKWTSDGGDSKNGMIAAPADRSTWPAHTQALKIPPAWTGVHINPDPEAALQAIGKDSKGRDQYVYSQRFKDGQAAAKFARIQELDAKFDSIRKENDANLKTPDKRVREHAECSKLIMSMGIRPGSEEDTQAKVKAYGATTLLGKHVVQEGDQTYLRFTGKKGVELNLPVTDSRVASMLSRRASKAGEDGQLFPNVSAGSLLTYTHQFDGGDFKTKDFRTLLGTRQAMQAMKGVKAPRSEREYKKAVMAVAKTVATKLGNTPAVALQSYIAPIVFSRWRSRLAM